MTTAIMVSRGFGLFFGFVFLTLSAAGGLVLFPQVKFSGVNSSQQCILNANLYEAALQNQSSWAVRMWDASAKQPVGWLSGNTAQFGNFDECMATTAPMPLQFCLSQLQLTLPAHALPNNTVWHDIQRTLSDRVVFPRSLIWVGSCLPAACTPTHVGTVGSNTALDIPQWKLLTASTICTKPDRKIYFSIGAISFLVCSAAMGIVIIIASAIDTYFKKFNGYPIINWLSLRKNYGRLVRPPGEQNHPLGIAHGLRVVSVILVLYAHRLAIPFTFTAFYQEAYEANARDPIFKFFAQLDMTVDTYFFLSGLLLSYPARPIHGLVYIVHRIIRLSPLYLWVIWLEASVVPALGSGPLWDAVQVTESRHCSHNWWISALFLNNYINDDQMCMAHTWYVPCEFHFFLLVLLLLYLIKWHRCFGLAVTAVITMVAVVTPGVITYLHNFEPFVLFNLPEFIMRPLQNELFSQMYTKSHNRAAPYLIGFLAGLYLTVLDQQPVKRSRRQSVVYLALSVATLFLPLAYGTRFYEPGSPHLQLEVALFTSLRRPLWSLALLFLILANRSYPLPLLGKLLSCRAAAVLSRLSYGVYLIHFPLIMANMANTRTPHVFNWFDVVFSGELASSFLMSAFMYLLIEQPIKQLLTGLCFSKLNRKTSSATLPVANNH